MSAQARRNATPGDYSAPAQTIKNSAQRERSDGASAVGQNDSEATFSTICRLVREGGIYGSGISAHELLWVPSP